MFVWVGIDVDGQYDEIRAKAMEVDKEMCFKHSCFTLPMHISLKISFEIDKNQFENIVETILSVYENIKPFEIPVKRVENHGNICWIRMWDNASLNALSAQINGILAENHGIPLHEYDLDFQFHTSLFMDDDHGKVDAAYNQVKDVKLPEKLIANRFVIGTSESGRLGTYKVVLVVDK